MKVLLLEASRDAYSPENLRTMTVGELIKFLEDFDEGMPVVLSHDSGYTYGGITEKCFFEASDEMEDDEDA